MIATGSPQRRTGPRRALGRLVCCVLVPALTASACGLGLGSEVATSDSTTTSGVALSSADAGIAANPGIDDTTIRIGYSVDLSGIFAPTIHDIMTGSEVYWEFVNHSGGIAGRTVEPIVLDSYYDIPGHVSNYRIMTGEDNRSVAMILSHGSPHTAAIAQALVEDQMAAIPLSWYSGWADPGIGPNVFEVQSNYCLEAMNGVTYLSQTYGSRIAVVTFPGELGQDAAAGAKHAARELGLEVVYDGEGAVIPGGDLEPVIDAIVASDADVVWVSVNPGALKELIAGAAARGFTGMWSGNHPSYETDLLETEAREALDLYYIHSTYMTLWNTGDAPGMADLVTQMRLRRPDAPLSDLYTLGWIYGLVVRQALERAEANGDLSRAGVTEALRQITVDLAGLAPNQTWAGSPNDNVVRHTYLYDIVADEYTPHATVSDAGGSLGFRPLVGPYASPVAEAYDFQGACFTSG